MSDSGAARDVMAIFNEALEQPSPAERGAYLDLACGTDLELRARVETLLAVHDRAEGFLESPAQGATSDVAADAMAEVPGRMIGPYKLLEQIGEGGMGVVYMAEQIEPVRRKVALKIVKPGMDTKQVIARFEAERQALALMEHPNIARVLDAGATESGRPYFAMELVRGIPITEYCDQQRLCIDDRLDLFVIVCLAVQHAHQKGIIHRDIKPSNVLITLHDGVPVPKVIDFGIAKATGQTLTEKTLFTAFTQLIGTPLYMSPEQAELSGIDIDTRSDIYSLGVLLYELLTGTTPFDQATFGTAALDEVRRIIREQDPPTPSTRLSSLGATQTTVSANRQTDPRRLNRSLRGELDWITMKSLEKDRPRRYETASAFATDIVRYRTNQPVAAGPPSSWYRWRKYARRNRVGIGLSFVGLMLILMAAQGVWQAEHLRQARQLSRIQAETIRQRDELIRAENARKLAAGYVRGIQDVVRMVQIGDAKQALALLQSLGASPDDYPRGFEWSRLERLCRGSPLILSDHQGDVYAAAYSPDGATLATCGKDGTIRLRDSVSGKTRRVIGPVGTELNGLSFSVDGSRLASCGDDSRIRIWDVGSGNDPVLEFGTHEDKEVVGVLYTPDGRWLLSYGRDAYIKRWDAAAGKLSTTWSGHVSQIETAAIAKRGSTLVVAGGDPSVHVHDWSAGKPIKPLEQDFHREPVCFYGVALSADGRLAASQEGRNEVSLWDVEAARVVRRLQGQHHNLVYSMAFSPDERNLATLGVDGELRLWNLSDGASTARVTGHVERSWCVTFSPDGRRVVTTGREGTVRIWDLHAWTEATALVAQLRSPRTIAFSSDDKGLAAFDVYGGAATYNVETGILFKSEKGVGQAAVSRDGRRRAFSGGRGRIEVTTHNGGDRVVRLGWPGFDVAALALTENGRLLAAAGGSSVEGTSTRLFDVETGEKVAWRLADEGKELTTRLRFSPDGKRLAGWAGEKTLWVWTLDRDEVLKTSFESIPDSGFAFSPDGALLAVGGHERMIALLDSETLELQARFINHTGGIYDLDFSPDGRTLASASADGTVRLWNVKTTQELMKLEGHTGPVRCVRFSHDGLTLASAAETTSGACEVILWHGGVKSQNADIERVPTSALETR
jgi:WD40 repeat protein/serine/threonine protein kinase